MKRVLNVAIVAVLIAALFATVVMPSATSVSATSEPSVTETVDFNVSSAFSATDGTAKIFVDIAPDSRMSSGVFKLSFDTTKLEAKSVDVGNVLKDGYVSKNITQEGYVKVSYANSVPLGKEDGGRLFEVEFDVVGGLAEGETIDEIAVQLVIEELQGYDYVNIVPSVNNGFINIIDIPFGDVNNMNGVTPSDALMILNHSVGNITLDENQLVRADVNGDGSADSFDALQILQYTAGHISNYMIFEIKAPIQTESTATDETSVSLTWDPVELAIGYNIYMDGIKINENLITGTTYEVTGLEQNTKYVFSISAVNTLKESPIGTEFEVSTNKADREVRFLDYDGTTLNRQIVLSSENAIAPANPNRSGYTFVGWDKSLENITENTVITALYEINDYQLSFDSKGGSDVTNQILEYNTIAEKPTNPIRDGYTFMGWYKDSAYTEEWDFTVDKIERDTVLYAKWQTWSTWLTELPADVTEENYIIESREESRSQTKSTTTSNSSSLQGWTKYDTTKVWGSWSSWSKNYVSETSNRDVEVKTVTDKAAYTQYRYWRYRYGNNLHFGICTHLVGSNGSKYYKEYTSWSTSRKSRARYGQSCSVHYKTVYVYGGTSNTTSGTWFYEESRVIPAVTHKEYRYRNAIYTYYYYKWSDWSDWSTNEKVADSTTNVETRTTYRYIPIEK